MRSPACLAFLASTAGLGGLAAHAGEPGLAVIGALGWGVVATTGVCLLIGWCSRGYDGIRGRSPEAVVERIGRTLTDGAIVMLHDAAEHDDFEPASLRALPRLVRLLDGRGLTSVGLDELFGD